MIRAAFATRAAWPRSAEALAHQVAEAHGRADAPHAWVPYGGPALIDALRSKATGPVAAPAWGHAAYGPLLTDARWMPPARRRLDPGPSEVAAALADGASAVLLAPVGGDVVGLREVADLCRRKGVPLALDVRFAAGGRVLDGPPGALGDLALVSVDGEPGPAPCPGAVLLGAAPPSPAPGTGAPVALLRDALRVDPRLRRILGPPQRDTSLAPQEGAAPPWAFAAAAARLQQSAHRASQRARHAGVLRKNLSHVEGVLLPDEPRGAQSAGGALGLRVQGRDAVAERLAAAGIPTLARGGWLAPEGARDTASEALAAEALFLPLLPFYRPRDLDHLGEQLRRAALASEAV